MCKLQRNLYNYLIIFKTLEKLWLIAYLDSRGGKPTRKYELNGDRYNFPSGSFTIRIRQLETINLLICEWN